MKRLSEYIQFVHSHHETQDKRILIGVFCIVKKKPVTPPWPTTTTGGGLTNDLLCRFNCVWEKKNFFKDHIF